mmetsp:Transcript_79715/g.182599  ORF Transcript_79715/g.182599 Transcript_79715/m.182599 type:complete len:256 (-) Transcript_79715:194-961(-)
MRSSSTIWGLAVKASPRVTVTVTGNPSGMPWEYWSNWAAAGDKPSAREATMVACMGTAAGASKIFVGRVVTACCRPNSCCAPSMTVTEKKSMGRIVPWPKWNIVNVTALHDPHSRAEKEVNSTPDFSPIRLSPPSHPISAHRLMRLGSCATPTICPAAQVCISSVAKLVAGSPNTACWSRKGFAGHRNSTGNGASMRMVMGTTCGWDCDAVHRAREGSTGKRNEARVGIPMPKSSLGCATPKGSNKTSTFSSEYP